MKKLNYLLAMLVMGAVYASCSKEDISQNMVTIDNLSTTSIASTGSCTPNVSTLWAGKTIDAGTVTVTNDDEFIYLTYQLSGEWLLKEVHLYVLNYAPTSRLAPGLAPFNSGILPSGTTFYTFSVPNTYECDQMLYLQAHAAIYKVDQFGNVIESQTGFGGDITWPKKASWYGNIAYTICCEDNEEPCYQYETAFGGNTEGPGKGAWWFYYDGDGVETIWAGQIIEVGTVELVGEMLTITLTNDWELANSSEAVKIQGYNELPNERPAAGLFTTYKGTDLVVSLPQFEYYVIHLDVRIKEDCQTTE